MVNEEIKLEIALLLAKQSELARLGLGLGPRDRMRLKSLLLKTGWYKSINMQRKKARSIYRRKV